MRSLGGSPEGVLRRSRRRSSQNAQTPLGGASTGTPQRKIWRGFAARAGIRKREGFAAGSDHLCSPPEKWERLRVTLHAPRDFVKGGAKNFWENGTMWRRHLELYGQPPAWSTGCPDDLVAEIPGRSKACPHDTRRRAPRVPHGKNSPLRKGRECARLLRKIGGETHEANGSDSLHGSESLVVGALGSHRTPDACRGCGGIESSPWPFFVFPQRKDVGGVVGETIPPVF